MRTKSQRFIERIERSKNLSERRIISDEFSLYYNSLDENVKKELNPYFDNLKIAINQKIEKLDVLADKAEGILAKFQIAEV